MDITAQPETYSTDEKLLYSQFKRKINTEAARAQIKKLEYDLADVRAGLSYLKTACIDCNSLGIGSICVLPNFVKRCSSLLGAQRKVLLVARISSVDGGDVTPIKIKAVKQAVKDGADAVDVTVPIAHVRDGNFVYVKKEIKKLRSASRHKTFRINLNCTYLTREEIIRTCTIAADCGVNAVCVSGSNCIERISEVKTAIKDKCVIKSEGAATVIEMSGAVDLGAGIIGSKNAADVARAILTAAESEL